MMHMYNKYFLFLICFLLSSCIFNEPTEPTVPEGMDCLKDVIFLNETLVDSVSIINDTTITMYSTQALTDTLMPGRKFVYSHSKTAEGFCLGIVRQVEDNSPVYLVHTTIPSFDEIFSELSLAPEFNLTNLHTEFVADESDNVVFTGIVDNSIWDEIETIYQEDTTNVSQSPARVGTTNVPIDITLSFDVKPNKAFSGTIYLRLQGSVNIHNCKTYELDVHQTVGILGSFAMAEASIDRKHIPLLQIKNGITIYSNKIVGIRLKPSLNFFYGGGIKLEAGFKYEMINADIRSVFDGNNFKSFTSENKKDYYFRVKSLHSEGEFGLSMVNDLYAFVFTDNFFAAGVNAEAGLSISGEKNVGIQFPDIANFDFSVMFTPFLEITPFAKIRTPQLKRFDGPTFKMNTEAFSVDLLPNIHNINYEKKSNKMKVSANVTGTKTSFIQSKETGMALFAKGNDTPIAYQPIMYSSSSAPHRVACTNDVEFDISGNQEYELAKYVKTESGEVAFGEHLAIEDDAVDLGLSILWACCNVGAEVPEEYGSYYAWGETIPKLTFSDNNYKWWNDNIGFTKYNLHNGGDGKRILDLCDDAAAMNWGGKWRTPTFEEIKELINNCTWTWYTKNGVSGSLVVGPSGKSIFLPASGYYDEDEENEVPEYVGDYAQYWSSSLNGDEEDAYFLWFDNENHEWDYNSRMAGLVIRPVCPK